MVCGGGVCMGGGLELVGGEGGDRSSQSLSFSQSVPPPHFSFAPKNSPAICCRTLQLKQKRECYEQSQLASIDLTDPLICLSSLCVHSLHPLFPGSNEVDQIAKIHDVLGSPSPSILQKLRK